MNAIKNNNRGKVVIVLLAFLISFFAACSTSNRINKPYIPEDKNLYDTIYYQDSILFNAFNSRDIEKLQQFFSDSLELYQDNIGVRSYIQTINAFKDLFKKDYVLTRRLVKGSLEVYPIKNYGAIETGRHTFCHIENRKLDCGTFKFLHIWKKEDGKWKITRIVTYDHK